MGEISKELRQMYLRRLPAVEKVLHEPALLEAGESIPRRIALEAVQEAVAARRSSVLAAAAEEELQKIGYSSPELAQEALKIIAGKMGPSLKPVINATGVLLHTNLGRATLAPAALEAITSIGAGYSNLELCLETGKRSSRHDHVERLLCRLTGAEGALVVNNNAGAVFLALNTLAAGGETIVSRGELVEIGGSFRLPEVMAAGGTTLVEVGATNKCFLQDYKKAVNEKTALMLKVHTSNYKILGFTASVPLSSLVKLAGEHSNIAVMEDLGSGVLIDLSKYGLPYEPSVQDSVAAGADVITFSGDKLLGGPQAGIVLGKKPYIERMKKNQMLRALRIDKLTLAALEATLRLYLDEEKALREIPILRMLTVPVETLAARAQGIVSEIRSKLGDSNNDNNSNNYADVSTHAPDFSLGISREKARVGGGSLPLLSLNSCQVYLAPKRMSCSLLAEKLRSGHPPILARIRKNRLLFDLRTVREEEDELLLQALLGILTSSLDMK